MKWIERNMWRSLYCHYCSTPANGIFRILYIKNINKQILIEKILIRQCYKFLHYYLKYIQYLITIIKEYSTKHIINVVPTISTRHNSRKVFSMLTEKLENYKLAPVFTFNKIKGNGILLSADNILNTWYNNGIYRILKFSCRFYYWDVQFYI